MLWCEGPAGDPHASEPDPLLLRLGADTVLGAALDLLGRRYVG